MVTTTAGQQAGASAGPAAPRRRRFSRSTIALGVAFGFFAGAAVYAAVDEDPVSGTGPIPGTVSVLSPSEIAEFRAEGRAALLEQQWLSDPVNVARLRAEERARLLERAFAGGG